MDVTIGTKDTLGKLFAPASWDLVMAYKSGNMSEQQYTKKYLSTLEYRYKHWPEHFKKAIAKREVTFVCFCAAGEFCHRLLIVKWLEERFPGKCKYMGEQTR